MTLSNSTTVGETGTQTVVRTLTAERATAEALAAFGALIGGPPDESARLSNFYDQAVMVQKSPFQSALPVEISVCTIEPRALRVRWMERHFQHTQAFLPLGGKPFVMVLAPPTEDDLPDPDAVRAFLFDGSAGFLLHIGVWHEFPFAVEPNTQVAVLLTKEATQGLSRDNMVGTEGYSADLEKKDMAIRLGMEWEVRA
ncbi:MAG: ureidoglycolate lyase [Sphingobium sp.]